MRSSTNPPRNPPRINYVNSAPKPVAQTLAPPSAPAPVAEADQFIAPPPAQALPQPPPAPTDLDRVNAMKAYLSHNRDAKMTADAIMTCLSPLISGTGKGAVEVQIQVLLMRILANMERTKRNDSFEQARVEELKKSLRAKDALAELRQIERSLENERKAHAQEQDRGMETCSAVARAQNDMLMTSLRDMRAS